MDAASISRATAHGMGTADAVGADSAHDRDIGLSGLRLLQRQQVYPGVSKAPQRDALHDAAPKPLTASGALVLQRIQLWQVLEVFISRVKD